MVLALVQAVIALVVAFGLKLEPDQIGAILAVTAVILGAHHAQPGEPGVVRDGHLRGSLPRTPTVRQVDVLAAFVAAGGSVAEAAERVGVRPSTAKRHCETECPVHAGPGAQTGVGSGGDDPKSHWPPGGRQRA